MIASVASELLKFRHGVGRRSARDVLKEMVYDRSIEEKTTDMEMKGEGGRSVSKETRNRGGLDEAEEDVGGRTRPKGVLLFEDEERRAILRTASRRDDDRSIPRARIVDIPFEFVGEVASTRAMAKASDVEGGATTRHDDDGDDR